MLASTATPLPSILSRIRFHILSRAVPARADITPIARGARPPRCLFSFLGSQNPTPAKAFNRAVGSFFLVKAISRPSLV